MRWKHRNQFPFREIGSFISESAIPIPAWKLPDKIVYSYKKADYQRLRERLDIDWTTYLQTDHADIEEMWGKFILMFNQAEKEFIPKKVVKMGKRKFSHPIDKKNV